MSTPGAGEPRRRPAPWGLIALVLLTGLALIRNGSGEVTSGPPQPASSAAAAGDRSPAPAAGRVLGFSAPRRVRIPGISVDAPVRPVGLDGEGWVAAPPPADPNLAGWYTGGVSPGQKGAAVIVGHVDNDRGPAVFYGLGALRKGHRVEVERADGGSAVFEVYGVEVFSKEDFPGDRVYGPTAGPELRIITCGGRYRRGSGYEGNVVVFAREVAIR